MNITIHRNEGGAFFVLHGDKLADQLTYEEMLGLVAQLAMPTQHRAMAWLKTAEAWRDQARSSALRHAGVAVIESPVDLGEFNADARVRGDWTPVEAGGEAPPIMVENIGAEPITMETSLTVTLGPIHRADVQLKVGDVVTDGSGKSGAVRTVGGLAGAYQVAALDSVYTIDGRYSALHPNSERDIVSVNSHPIIDAEEG